MDGYVLGSVFPGDSFQGAELPKNRNAKSEKSIVILLHILLHCTVVESRCGHDQNTSWVVSTQR
jgi:hypothetical protein